MVGAPPVDGDRGTKRTGGRGGGIACACAAIEVSDVDKRIESVGDP